jgi:hypothetical protein
MDESFIKFGPEINATNYNLAITKIPSGKYSGNL